MALRRKEYKSALKTNKKSSLNKSSLPKLGVCTNCYFFAEDKGVNQLGLIPRVYCRKVEVRQWVDVQVSASVCVLREGESFRKSEEEDLSLHNAHVVEWWYEKHCELSHY